jgi:predicted PurR-regulated permease PerM
MTEPANLDRVRTAALARIEQAERKYKFGIVFVALFEAVFGLAFLWLMDFRERLHWLILIAACLTYGMVIICTVNLGNYVNSATHTILRAIFARDQGDQGTPST